MYQVDADIDRQCILSLVYVQYVVPLGPNKDTFGIDTHVKSDSYSRPQSEHSADAMFAIGG